MEWLIKTRRIFILFALLTFISPSWSSTAAGSGAENNYKPQQKIRIVYQVSDITVRDKRGSFVENLTEDDFILLVDGKRTEIKFVEEYCAPNEAAIREYFAMLEKASADSGNNPPPLTPPRIAVIAFDQYNMGPASAMKSREAAIRIVNEVLLPYDKVAVLQYNGFFVTLTGPTSDRDTVLSAIKKVGEPTRNRYYYPHPLELFPPHKQDLAETERKTLELVLEKTQRFRHYLVSLSALATTLNSIPGRKICFLFSDGPNTHNPLDVPGSIDEWRKNYVRWVRSGGASRIGEKYETLELTPAGLKPQKEEMARYFSSSNSSIYTVRRGSLEPEWLTTTLAGLEKSMSKAAIGSTKVTARLNRMLKERSGTLKDIAVMTNGKFFDAGISDEELIEAIRKEIRNYYIIGFVPPEGSGKPFHNISVRPRDSGCRVTHREGFFEKKKFNHLTAEEKEIHMEEGFLSPGILDELDLRAVGCELPLTGRREAIIAFDLDFETLDILPGGGRELELVINVVDLQGSIKYREHKIFKLEGSEGEFSRVWHSLKTPLLKEWCAAHLGLRDNAGGRRSTWNKVFEPRETTSGLPQLGDALMLSATDQGSIGCWSQKNIDKDVDAEITVESSGIEISMKPLVRGEVSQGDSVQFLVTIANLPREFDPSKATIGVVFALDPDTEEGYLLSASDVKIQYLAESGALVVTASVPVGLAQKRSGSLVAAVSGLAGNNILLAILPYNIIDFSPDRAAELLSNAAIRRLQ